MWHWTFTALSGLLLLLTALPFSKRQEWWIRGLDFPRFQFALFGFALLIAGSLTLDLSRPSAWAALAVTALCTLYQTWWILPYTPFFRREVKRAAPSASTPRLRIMAANVLMTNRRAHDLVAIVRAEKPDVLVTLETNQWWERQLAVLEPDYPHTLKCPLDNLYGMHLFSRLPLADHRLQFLVEPDVPSLHTLILLPSGHRVRLHCLHPAPPSPTENETSRERDAELIMVGKSAARARLPVIVSGDLNDVAWSDTTRLFRKISRLLDPRIGRGRFNTYHARNPLFRWPVDHFFHSRDFSCVEIKRLPAFGSDHFPVLVELALDDRSQEPALKPDQHDAAEADEKMDAATAHESKVHAPGETPSP